MTGQAAPSVDVVVVRSTSGWRAVLERLERQTVRPRQVIVEVAASEGREPSGRAVLVPPGTGFATASADLVCLLDDRDRPAPGWLAEVVCAARSGADVVRWGVLHLRPDGVVAAVDIPPVSGRSGRLGRCGYAVRRAATGADGRVRARAYGIPRLLVKRCDSAEPSAGEPLAARPLAGDESAAQARRRPALPAVSVVLPVRNAAGTLHEQLTALAAQDYRGWWELVVVDNASTDGSRAVVAAFSERLAECRIVPAVGSGNAGRARNVGAGAAKGDLLVFCDADDVADPGWLSAMVAACRRADLVGGALDCTRLSPAFLDEQPVPLPQQPDFLPFARSANCAIWRDVLSDVGGWPESFRGGGGEDVDLSWRAQLMGYRLAYAHDARMEYRLRPTVRAVARQKWHYGLTAAPLYRAYRHAGYQRRPWRAVLRSWLWLARHLPDLARPGHARRRWVRYATRLAGFAAGSIRHRVRYL